MKEYRDRAKLKSAVENARENIAYTALFLKTRQVLYKSAISSCFRIVGIRGDSRGLLWLPNDNIVA